MHWIYTTLYYYMSTSLNAVSFKPFLYTATNIFDGYHGHGLETNVPSTCRLDSSVPVLITLITNEEGNKQLLMEEVEEEFGKLTLGFDAIAQTETVTRFGQ